MRLFKPKGDDKPAPLTEEQKRQGQRWVDTLCGLGAQPQPRERPDDHQIWTPSGWQSARQRIKLF